MVQAINLWESNRVWLWSWMAESTLLDCLYSEVTPSCSNLSRFLEAGSSSLCIPSKDLFQNAFLGYICMQLLWKPHTCMGIVDRLALDVLSTKVQNNMILMCMYIFSILQATILSFHSKAVSCCTFQWTICGTTCTIVLMDVHLIFWALSSLCKLNELFHCFTLILLCHCIIIMCSQSVHYTLWVTV